MLFSFPRNSELMLSMLLCCDIIHVFNYAVILYSLEYSLIICLVLCLLTSSLLFLRLMIWNGWAGCCHVCSIFHLNWERRGAACDLGCSWLAVVFSTLFGLMWLLLCKSNFYYKNLKKRATWWNFYSLYLLLHKAYIIFFLSRNTNPVFLFCGSTSPACFDVVPGSK